MPTLAKAHDADRLARHAAVAGAALHDEILDAIVRRVEAIGPAPRLEQILEAAAEALREHAEPLAHLLADSALASWLLGAAGVSRLLPPPRRPSLAGGAGHVLPPGGPPVSAAGGLPWRGDWDGSPVWLPAVDAAVEDLRRRELVSRDQWDQLSAVARAKAFTAAGVSTEEALEVLRDTLADTLDTGGGARAYRQAVEDALGESPLSLGRLDNVFQTNAAVARSRGMDAIVAHPVVQDLYPYEETLPIQDSRLTDLCWTIARSGIQKTGIFRRVDPVWAKFKPPRHWRCRCGRRFLSREGAAARGIASARRWLETGVDPRDFVPTPAVDLPNGWTPHDVGVL